MAVPRKPDADQIKEYLKGLPSALNLGQLRWVWPRFVYRFDDVVTVAAILREQVLLSRSECKRRGIVHRDQANTEIIENTPHLHGFARLFFRPRTPTQFRMEGIRTKAVVALHRGAHCPVPVFLLFRSTDVLTRAGVLFTDGSPTRRNQYLAGDDIDFLRKIPFQQVYHEGGMGSDPATKSEIILRRHAEILVPDELDLDGLAAVVCRTDPERQTLLNLLGNEAAKWTDRIRTELPNENLFFRQGFFFSQVTLIDEKIYLSHARHRGAFTFFFSVSDAVTGRLLRVLNRPNTSFTFSASTILLPRRCESVMLEITIDGATAFRGVLHQRPPGGIVR
jgi:ssDNA thymidine ADP-ribosyltransferase, DarT